MWCISRNVITLKTQYKHDSRAGSMKGQFTRLFCWRKWFYHLHPFLFIIPPCRGQHRILVHSEWGECVSSFISTFLFSFLTSGRRTLPGESSSSFLMAWWLHLCQQRFSATRSCQTLFPTQNTSQVRNHSSSYALLAHSCAPRLHHRPVRSSLLQKSPNNGCEFTCLRHGLTQAHLATSWSHPALCCRWPHRVAITGYAPLYQCWGESFTSKFSSLNSDSCSSLDEFEQAGGM